MPFTATEELLHAVFDASSDAICIYKCIRNTALGIVDFEYAFVNRTAAKLLQRKDLAGKRLGREFPAAKAGKTWQHYLSVMHSGKPAAIEETDLLTGQVSVITAVKINEDFLVSSCGITDENKKIPAAQQLPGNEAYSQIIRDMAHALRNPLSSVYLSSQLIQEHLQENPQTNIMPFFTIINRSAKKMESMLMHFLNPARPNAMHGTKDICEVLDIALDRASDRIVLSGCRIDKSYRKGFFVSGDMEKLAAALLNIIMLALECIETGKGEMWIAVFHHPDKVSVIIKDNGRGMEPEMAEQVFEPWYIHESSGFGTGLYQTRMVLQDHNASIGLSSEPGSGSSYVIVFKKQLNDN